jgi:hypothetical protein
MRTKPIRAERPSRRQFVDALRLEQGRYQICVLLKQFALTSVTSCLASCPKSQLRRGDEIAGAEAGPKRELKAVQFDVTSFQWIVAGQVS